MSDFFNQEQIKAARFKHKCDLCGTFIAAGESYFRQSGKFEGEFFNVKLHERCKEVVGKYCSDYSDDGGWVRDDVYYVIREDHCTECEKYDECDLNEIKCDKAVGGFLK